MENERSPKSTASGCTQVFRCLFWGFILLTCVPGIIAGLLGQRSRSYPPDKAGPRPPKVVAPKVPQTPQDQQARELLRQAREIRSLGLRSPADISRMSELLFEAQTLAQDPQLKTSIQEEMKQLSAIKAGGP